MTATENEDLNFEDALAQLENIVRELESGRIKLDDAVNAYEKAVKLKQLCENKLQAAKLKIEKIELKSDGSIETTPFEVPESQIGQIFPVN